MHYRDRIKDFRRVQASTLRPNPKNWRTHPDAQREALEGILAEVGYADALLAREVNGDLVLIDGHLRADTTPEQEVPVLVLDVTEEEADKLLAVIDPMAALAEPDTEALGRLLAGLETGSEALQAMLDGLGESWSVEGVGMPDLPEGDRAPFQQMTFTLSDDQAADVKRALASAKAAGPFVDSENENSNGNALARIVEAYLGTC